MSERDDERVLVQGLSGIAAVAVMVAVLVLLGFLLAVVTALVF